MVQSVIEGCGSFPQVVEGGYSEPNLFESIRSFGVVWGDVIKSKRLSPIKKVKLDLIEFSKKYQSLDWSFNFSGKKPGVVKKHRAKRFTIQFSDDDLAVMSADLEARVQAMKARLSA